MGNPRQVFDRRDLIEVIIDIGESKDIHPKNKLDVGHRLALAARHIAYHEPIEYSGPVYRQATPEGNQVRVWFTHADGLQAKGGAALAGFTIAGADGTFVPANPNFRVQVNPSTGACISNCWNIPVPYNQLVTPGGDLSLNGNFEYRITIAGPVAIAPFVDMGADPIIRTSQLQTNLNQYNTLINTLFGCPTLDTAYACTGGAKISGISRDLRPVPGTNWVARMSTGIELQTMLPVVNAPFRIYYAYNALRLDGSATPPIQITRDMFPNNAAGLYTYQTTLSTLGSRYTLREPRKTFRFSVATTF